VSNRTCLRVPRIPILELPGETESGSAHDATRRGISRLRCANWNCLEKRSRALLTTQPDEGYPGSAAPMTRQAPDGQCRRGPFSFLPLDTGPMP